MWDFLSKAGDRFWDFVRTHRDGLSKTSLSWFGPIRRHFENRFQLNHRFGIIYLLLWIITHVYILALWLEAFRVPTFWTVQQLPFRTPLLFHTTYAAALAAYVGYKRYDKKKRYERWVRKDGTVIDRGGERLVFRWILSMIVWGLGSQFSDAMVLPKHTEWVLPEVIGLYFLDAPYSWGTLKKRLTKMVGDFDPDSYDIS